VLVVCVLCCHLVFVACSVQSIHIHTFIHIKGIDINSDVQGTVIV
jgi:hypothetical protein